MATVRKLVTGNKSWQAIVRRKGFKSLSKTFYKKSDADRWANQKEIEISQNVFIDFSDADDISFLSAIDRYQVEVGRVKLLSRQFRSQVNILKSYSGFSDVSLSSLTPAIINDFKLFRIGEGVSASTIKKDLSFLHRFLNVVITDWLISLPHGNPVDKVSRPLDKTITSRTRRLEAGEFEQLFSALSKSPIVQKMVVLAVETAMRRSEILNIKPEHINFEGRTLLIPQTKTGVPRTIPLTCKAIDILNAMPTFEIKADSVTQCFKRACKRQELDDLRFHDLRHEATSRLFEKGLNPVQVAFITGHKDFRMLQRYTHLRAEDVATLI